MGNDAIECGHVTVHELAGIMTCSACPETLELPPGIWKDVNTWGWILDHHHELPCRFYDYVRDFIGGVRITFGRTRSSRSE